MLKRIIPFPTLLLFAAVTGCGGGADQTRSASSSAENQPPEITLAGTPMVNVALGTKYVDPGFTATDLEDGDITHLIVTNADTIDTTKEGVQKVTYQVRDSGNVSASTMVRAVSVVAAESDDQNSDHAAVAAEADSTRSLDAKDDYFLVKTNQDNTLSVSLNDAFTSKQTTVEVVQDPREGTMTMKADGTFTYRAHQDFVGIDTFIYEARDGHSVQQATVSIDVGSDVDPTSLGFTAITPSADSKRIYVSSSMGSDENDCETPSAPCESLEAAFAKVRAGMPDHVYLKRGDVWRDQKLAGMKSGRSIAEPAVVSFYGGSGARPKIEHSDGIIRLTDETTAVQFLNIIGLHFDAYKMEPDSPEFTGTNEDLAPLVFLTNNEDVLLEDNVFDHLEIVIQRYNEKDPKNFTLRRNIWTGAYGDTSSFTRKKRPSNIYADGVDGLVIEDNVFDYGGWNPEAEGAAGNMYNHNLYLQFGNNGDRVVLRNNIITRGSSHGVQMRAGGVAEENFFGRNAVGLLIGYNKVPLKDGVKAHAINNVITEGVSMIKGDEPCSGKGLCTRARWGMDFYVNGNADWLAQGNVVHSLDESDDSWMQKYDELITRAFRGIDDPAVKASDNLQSSWGESLLEGVTETTAEGRTLGDYYHELVSAGDLADEYIGEDNFDRFMTAAKERGLQQWNEKLTAKAINDYIRAGFNL